MKNLISVQQWVPIIEIFNNGIIKTKENSYIKILKIIPINYKLKSELEKEAILNSYKIFLKTCNFNIQIIIQSKKLNLNQIISKIENESKKEENKKIQNIFQNYNNYIKKLNNERKSSSKIFYIIIKKEKGEDEEKIFEELNEKAIKIKENLKRCGNEVINIKNKNEIINIFLAFLNKKKEEGER